MATGASNSDAAVILIDARKGVLTQTRRHSYICSLLGIRHVVRGGEQDRPGGVLRASASTTSSATTSASPSRWNSPRSRRFRCRRASATTSRARSEKMRWYDGPTLLEHLEGLERRAGPGRQAVPFPGAVGQPSRTWISAGFSGTVASGVVRAGRPTRRRRFRARRRRSRASSRRMAICRRRAPATRSP